MSSASVLIQKIQQRREFRVELGDGKSVTLLRPPEAEFFVIGRTGIGVAELERYARGWSGFTEADLYAGGGSDEVPFDAALWREVVSDRADWMGKCALALVEVVQRRADERNTAEGN